MALVRSTALAALLAAVALPAAAQDMFAGLQPYVRIDAGASISASDGRRYSNVFGVDGYGDLDPSFLFGGGAGVAFASGLRADVTLSYRTSYDASDSASFNVAPGFAITGSADAEATSFVALANVYYDFAVGGGFKPFLGLGLGFAVNKLDDIKVRTNTGDSGQRRGDETTDFAWALMAGVSYEFGGGFAVEAGYRYLDAGDLQSSGDVTLNGVTGQSARIKEDLRLHELTIGLRYAF